MYLNITTKYITYKFIFIKIFIFTPSVHIIHLKKYLCLTIIIYIYMYKMCLCINYNILYYFSKIQKDLRY